MKKIKLYLFIVGILLLTSCTSNKYIQTMKKGYKKNKGEKTLYIKKDGKAIYSKTKIGSFFHGRKHGLVLKEENGKKILFLYLEYSGGDWIFMNGIDLVSETGTYTLNFGGRKFSTPYMREKSSMIGCVEEDIAIPLTEEEVKGIENILGGKEVKVVYHSELEKEDQERKLKEYEIQEMREQVRRYFK